MCATAPRTTIAPPERRHTARRIFERRRKHGCAGGDTVVKDSVRLPRSRSQEMFVPLTHPPGGGNRSVHQLPHDQDAADEHGADEERAAASIGSQGRRSRVQARAGAVLRRGGEGLAANVLVPQRRQEMHNRRQVTSHARHDVGGVSDLIVAEM